MFASNTTNITPCISLCYMDENNTCMGCYRTAEEITDWRSKPEDEKIAITIRCKKEIAKQAAILAEKQAAKQ